MDRFDLFRKIDEHIEFVIENTVASESDIVSEWMKQFDYTMDEMKKDIGG
ncbi:hypothetical protein [Bacillus toyonensis]|nr:hypothetical protein [Bacillus toyonensis]EJV41791.1 hypothetical protein IEA_05676 [Bacillus toyonensis]